MLPFLAGLIALNYQNWPVTHNITGNKYFSENMKIIFALLLYTRMRLLRGNLRRMPSQIAEIADALRCHSAALP